MTPVDGYALRPQVLSAVECDELDDHLQCAGCEQPGTRRLLDMPWCQALVTRLRASTAMADLLPAEHTAVQCTFFGKTAEQNWLVALHQDCSIAVRDRIDDDSCHGWSVKEGVWFVQPPTPVLEQLIAVRVHLDDCGPDDGPLRVVPRSHDQGRLTAGQIRAMRQQNGEVDCLVPRGGAMLMRPLLLHASSRMRSGGRRRVLHFVFGPRVLPCGLAWRQMV